jgi:hypothetical protein
VAYKLTAEVKAMPGTLLKKIQALRLSHRQQSGQHDYHILYKKKGVILTLTRKKLLMRGMSLMQCEPRKSVGFDDPKKLRTEVKRLPIHQEYEAWAQRILLLAAVVKFPSLIDEQQTDR